MSTVGLVDTGPKITVRYYFSHDFIQHHIKSYFSDASGTDSGMWCWTTSKYYFPKESARSGKCNQTGSKNSDGCGCLFLFTPEDKVDPLLFNWKSKLQNRCRQQLGFFFFTPIFITVEASLKKGSLTCFCSFQPGNGADSDVVFLVWAVREKWSRFHVTVQVMDDLSQVEQVDLLQGLRVIPSPWC